MLRRNFLRGLLVSPIIGLAATKTRPQKTIRIFTGPSNMKRVRFVGKQCLPGQGVMWNNDGSVSRPGPFAGVSADEIKGGE